MVGAHYEGCWLYRGGQRHGVRCWERTACTTLFPFHGSLQFGTGPSHATELCTVLPGHWRKRWLSWL